MSDDGSPRRLDQGNRDDLKDEESATAVPVSGPNSDAENSEEEGKDVFDSDDSEDSDEEPELEETEEDRRFVVDDDAVEEDGDSDIENVKRKKKKRERERSQVESEDVGEEVGEGEESEGEESGDDIRKRKRKRRRSFEEELDEEDLALLEENTGVRLSRNENDSPSGERSFKRLKQRSQNKDDRSRKERDITAIFDDVPDDQMDRDDLDDFIEDDLEDEEMEDQASRRDRYVDRSERRGLRGTLDFGGADMSEEYTSLLIFMPTL